MTVEAVPAHVPTALLRDFDYLGSSSNDDVYKFFGCLHAGPDIFFTQRNQGHWVVTRFVDMEYMLEHTAEFNSETHTVPKEGKPFSVPLVEYDGALHADFRKLLSPFFMPKAVHALQYRMQVFTNALIDGFHASGECDFTRDFTLKMPIGIMMHVLGLPAADTPYLLELADNLVRGSTPQIREAAFRSVYSYIEENVILLRRASAGDDLFSALLQGTVDDGRLLTDQEIKGLGVLLVAAGLNTVANMLCFFRAPSGRKHQSLRAVTTHARIGSQSHRRTDATLSCGQYCPDGSTGHGIQVRRFQARRCHPEACILRASN